MNPSDPETPEGNTTRDAGDAVRLPPLPDDLEDEDFDAAEKECAGLVRDGVLQTLAMRERQLIEARAQLAGPSSTPTVSAGIASVSTWVEIKQGGLPEAVDALEGQEPTLSEALLCYWEEAGDYEIAYYDHEDDEWHDAHGTWIDCVPSHWQLIIPPTAVPKGE